LKQNCDVTIVGGGPAGATLAYELARKGIEVLLLDKERLPRYKCCAGGVTVKAAGLLEFDISRVAEDVIQEVSFTFNLGSPYLRRSNSPLMYTVMRDSLDHSLVQRAQRLGALLMAGQKVTRIQTDGDSVEVIAADNVFRSRIVAGADGAYSTVARELDMGRSIEYITAIESEIAVPEEQLAKWKGRAHLDLGCVPGGYAWVFPKRDHLSVGAGCNASRAKGLDTHYHKFLDSLDIASYAIASSCSHLIPTRTNGSIVWQNRALLLGDAAGLCDPLTGEGIYYAVLSAQLAARVIEDCLTDDKVKLESYQEAVDREIMAELRTARVLSRLFVRLPHLVFAMLNRTDTAWRTACSLLSGELKYSDIKGRAGGFKGIFKRMIRTQHRNPGSTG
jgi:geranylgeranyl reductase family protein